MTAMAPPPNISPQPGASERSRWFIVALLLAINLLNYVDRYVLAAVEPHIRQDLFPDGDAEHQRADGLSADRVPAELHDRGADLRLAVGPDESLVDHFRRSDCLEPGLGRVGPGQHLCHAARHAAVHRLWRGGLRAGGSHGAGRLVSGRASRPDSLAVLCRDSGRQRARLFAGGIYGRAFRLADGILCFAAAGNSAGTHLPCHSRSTPSPGRGRRADAARGQSQPGRLCQSGPHSFLRDQYAGHGGDGFCPGSGRVLDAQLYLWVPPRGFAVGRRTEPGAQST